MSLRKALDAESEQRRGRGLTAIDDNTPQQWQHLLSSLRADSRALLVFSLSASV